MMNIFRIITKLSVISVFTPKQGTPNPFIILYSTFHSLNQHPLHRPSTHYGFEDIKNVGDALLLFHKMVLMKPIPRVIHFNKLLDIVAKMEHYSQVVFLFKKLCFLGFEVNEYTMSIVVNCCCEMMEVEAGFGILGYFIKRGYDPDIVCVNCLIKGLFLRDDVVEAVCLFNRLIKEKLCEVTAFTISIVTNGLCKSGNVVRAVELLERMKQQGVELNVVVFNTVLDGLCKARMVDDAKALLFDMIERNILPDVVTYTSLIHGLCNIKKLDFARSLFNDLPSKKIYPNVITYNVIIQGLCRERLFQDAKEMLDQMERLGCLPNSVTYNIIIQNCLHRRDSIGSITLLKQIVGKDFQLDAPTFFLLLQQIQILRQMEGIYDDADVMTNLILKLISSEARHQIHNSNGDLIIQSLTQKLVSNDTR